MHVRMHGICVLVHACIYIYYCPLIPQSKELSEPVHEHGTSAMWVGPYTIGGRKGGAMEQQSHLILRVLRRILIFTEGTN